MEAQIDVDKRTSKNDLVLRAHSPSIHLFTHSFIHSLIHSLIPSDTSNRAKARGPLPTLHSTLQHLTIPIHSITIHSTPSPLRDISIQPIVLPLQKLLLDQSVDIPLDPTDLQRAPVPRRFNRLGHQLRMADALPGLQDAHNSGLGLVVAVGGDALVGLLVLGGRLFELDRVDFDAVLGVGEARVEGEGVGWGDFARAGVFGEGLDFGAGEGLERAV